MSKVLPYMVFAAAFAVYLMTAAPLITAGDAGELAAAASVLGVPHPPGYPVSCLLGRAFTLLPLGNAAYRLNVMTALLSAASALLVYKIAVMQDTRGGAGPPLGAAAVVLAMSFTGMVWGQATSVEVYPLQAALTLSVMYFLLMARRGGGFRYVYLSSFLFGLSVAAHYTALLFAPGFVFMLLFIETGRWDAKKALAACFFLLSGLSVFVYLVPRAYVGTPVNWGDPENFANFVSHIMRASYGDLASFRLGGLAAKNTSSGIAMLVVLISILLMLGLMFRDRLKDNVLRLLPYALAVLTVAYLAYLTRSGVTPRKLAYFISFFREEAPWALVLLAVAGMAAYLVRDRACLTMLALQFMAVLAVSLYRIPVNDRDYLLPLIGKFFMPLFILTGVLAAYGVFALLEALQGKGRWMGRASLAAAAALFVLPAGYLEAGYRSNDRSRSYYAYDYSSSILRGLEPDAVFLAEGDNLPFLFAYQKFVEDKRPDVEVFEDTGAVFRPYEEARMLFLNGARPLYSTVEGEVGEFPGVALERAGMVSRLPFSLKKGLDPWELYSMRVGGAGMAEEDYRTREIITDYYYYLGRRLLDLGKKDEARATFESALFIGHDFPWANYNIGNIMRDYYNDYGKAVALYKKTLKLIPGFAEGYQEVGKAMSLMGRGAEGAEYFRKALRLDPGLVQPYMGLALFHEGRGDLKAAVRYWESYLSRCPPDDRPYALENIKRLKKSLTPA